MGAAHVNIRGLLFISLMMIKQWWNHYRGLLNLFGLRVKTHVRAQDFLDIYDPQQHGCLLLDVRMPGLSGPELQIKLNEQGLPTLPIIFISGHGDVPLAVRVMKAGAIDFLTKPFNDQVLLESINKALRPG